MSRLVPCLQVFALLLCLIGSERAQTTVPLPLPPSPIGDSAHDFYDELSDCWVWDSESRLSPADRHAFQTDSHCNGKAMDGNAELVWRRAQRDGEIWKGQFRAGRFSGKATRQYVDTTYEASYVDGRRSGPTVHLYNHGGSRELNFEKGKESGRMVEIYAEGTRVEGQYEEGKRVGVWSRTHHDGSRFEYPAPPPISNRTPKGVLFGPDGVRINGIYEIPRMDVQASPPFVYPPISVRLNEQGVVLATIKVLEDGTVQDVRLARSSGFQRLDEAALNAFVLRHYLPGTVDGKPIASYVLVAQNFSLNDPRQ